MKVAHDPNHLLGYGYWTCSHCTAKFYPGGRPLHRKDCPVQDQGYEPCTYNYGPKEAKKVPQRAKSHGEDQLAHVDVLILADVRQQHSEFLEA